MLNAKYIFTFNPYNSPVESYYYNDPNFTEEETEAQKSSEMWPSTMVNKKQDLSEIYFQNLYPQMLYHTAFWLKPFLKII